MKEQIINSFLNSVNELDKEREGEKRKVKGVIKTLGTEIPKIIIRSEERYKLTKERFNVFSCLTRHHLEELHSKFLHYLLDPSGSHDCGIQFLETFIQVLQEHDELSSHLAALTSQDIAKAKVERELFIGRSYDGDIYGFIDLFIELPDLTIAIENKIWAGEQDRQIERYVNYCKTLNKKYVVLYLTLAGYSSEQAGNEAYYSISYEKEIVNWLEKSIKESWRYPSVYVGLNYYKNLITSRILNQSSNQVTMDIKDILLKEENRVFLKYTKEIQEATVAIRNDLRTEFFKKVLSTLNASGYSFVPVSRIVSSINVADVWTNQLRGFRLVSEEFVYTTAGSQKIYFCIEHNWSQLYYGLFVLDQREDTLKVPSQPVSEEIKALVGEKLNRKLDYTLDQPNNQWWFSKGYFRALNEGLGNDTLNYDFISRMDEIVQQFKEEINGYLTAWKATIKELREEMSLQ